MAAKADASDVRRKIWELESKINSLANQIQDLYRMVGSYNTSQVGGAIPSMINLDVQLFCKQSTTGPTGAMSVGLLDMVYFEPTTTRLNAGVGPTGGYRGFWSRGSGLI